MLFNTLVTSALVAATLAMPLAPGHKHHEHEQKRDVVTIYTTIGAQAGATAPAAATSSVAAASAPASSGVVSPGGSVGSAGAKGVTYSPYKVGGCKSASEVASDLAQLTGFDIIRIYGVDCNQVDNVLKAKQPNQKVFAGIFDVSQISQGIASIAASIKNTGSSWNDIHTISVGNELVNNGQATPAQIVAYVAQAKAALSGTGYTGPVVSVDTFIAVINNPALCDASDYIAINAHAFFDGHIAAADAGPWVLQQIQRVATTCPGKQVFVTETGWPSQGDSNGVAVPSKPNQEAAIASIKSTCGNDATLFTAFNDYWKVDGPFNAEKYWGIFN